MPSLRLAFAVRSFLLCMMVLGMAAGAWADEKSAKPSESWSGSIVSSACNADEAFNESPECTKSVPGAKFALYDDTNRVVYALEPQKSVSAHLGDTVTVHGTLHGEVIRLAGMRMLSIGLNVGQKAPAFSLRDQFDHAQTLETLKGPKGTVVLFFRSADW